MRQLAFSTCGNKDLSPASLAAYRAAGVRALEYSFPTEKYTDFDFVAHTREAEAADLSVWSVHLPFLPFETCNIASLDKDVCRISVKDQGEMLRRAAEAGIRTAVIHPSGEPNAPETRAIRMANAKECLGELAELAARLGMVIAVEDLPRTCLGNSSAEILELISVDDRLKVCFDTNHLLGEDIVSFIRAVGSKIHTLHISDYDFIDERHWMPGEGDIDWPAVMAALDEIGYEGPMLYELGFRAPRSLTRPRDLTAADFAENCAALLRGETPAPIGTRLPGLGREY